MKNRLEDLGKLSVLLEQLYNHEIFETYTGRPKDFEDWFERRTDDEKSEILHSIIYNIEDIQQKIAECKYIADGNNNENND